jgi:hypothetical protein
MEWKGLLQVVADSLQEETLPTAEIAQFLRGVHKWDADLPQHQFERYSQDLNALYKSLREKNIPLFVRLIQLLLPVLDPRKVIAQYWSQILKPSFLQSEDIDLLQSIRCILTESFKLKDESSHDMVVFINSR